MWKTALVLVVLLVLHARSSTAQDFLMLTNEQRIHIQVDRIRKGIQQEDTAKVLGVLSSEVMVGNKGAQSKAVVVRSIQDIFNSDVSRALSFPRPDYPRSDSRLAKSDYWDFDILNPKVTIEGDSAFVQCELVLWAGPTNKPKSGRGFRQSETFVFYSPPRQATPPPNTGDYRAFNTKSANPIKSWQLVGLDNLIALLEVSRQDPATKETQGDDAHE